MRICHIITRLIIGGAQENTLLTCEGLAERGHEVLLLAGPQTGPEGSLHDRAATGGYAFEVVDDLLREVRPRADLRCRRALTERLRAWRPDVVHTHSSKAGVLGRLAARDARAPGIVHTIHGMSFNRTQPWWKRRAFAAVERYAARCTDRILTVADAMTEQSLAAGVGQREQYATVYSGMEVERFDPALYDRQRLRADWGVKEDDVVVGTIARLFENKGYEFVLPAAVRAAKEEPKLRFVWVGGGPWRDRLERELESAGLRDRVILTGLVPPDEIPRLLSGMDLLVHASRWEGLPRTVVQALLMRVPAVAFAIDGTPEVVEPGRTGALVALGDVEPLAQNIVSLAGDSQLRHTYGQRGRQVCLERFDHRRMVSQIASIYESIEAASR